MSNVSSAQGGKVSYEKPQLKRIGSLESITQHAGHATKLDQTFPIGTDFGDLTFSDPLPK